MNAGAPPDLGAWAEELASGYLRDRGWAIIGRNFRCGPGEVDLVARRGDLVVFVEVKHRKNTLHGHPLESIGPRKRAGIEAAVRCWVARHGSEEYTYRFDAIAVTGTSGSTRIEHFEDAWRPVASRHRGGRSDLR